MPDRQKFALDIEVQSVIRQWFRHQPASLFASGIQKLGERTNVWANLDDNVEKIKH